MSTTRRFLLLAAVLVCAVLWRAAWAAAPASAPASAHAQVRQILPSLRDSEAEQASGSYVPGLGAVITLELLRGPNTVAGQPAHVGTRDWAIYLMQTFGTRLSAVPPDERIAFAIDYYDFTSVGFHQLVVSCPAAAAGDPARYEIWLDGKPYAELAGAEVQP